MARSVAFLLSLLLLAFVAPLVLARKSNLRPRRLGDQYSYGSPSSGSSPTTSSPIPSSGSSPTTTSPSTPYSPSSGSSPSSSSPSTPYTSPSSGSSPSSSSPTITPSTPSPVISPPETSTPSPVTVPPVTSTPSPVTIPPVTSSPTGGYGGYGSRSGSGTSGFWRKNSGRVPKVLSLLSTLAKLFGPRALKLFGGKLNLFGAIKNTSPDAMSSLAREGSTSLINAYAYNDFPLAVGDVITQFNDGLVSTDAAAGQAVKFQQFNEAL